ncbi:acyl carrier protein [Chytridium lagenaria]|nr:acyl carrier protein [Chytridium lagenaria]
MFRRILTTAPRTLPRLAAIPSAPRFAASPISHVFSRSYASEGLTIGKVQDRVIKVVKEFEKVDAAKVTLDSHFVNDLGLDSLDQVDLTMAIEEEFSIEIPDAEADNILTARQAADKVFSNPDAI